MKYKFRYTTAKNLKVLEATIDGETFSSTVEHFFFYLETYTNTPSPINVLTVKKVLT